MANRLNAPNQFEALSPPWLLTSLDTNFTQNQSAWNDSSLGFVNGIPIDTGSANIYAVTLPFGSPSSYQDGMCVPFIPNNTNTGSSTMTVSPLGAVSILNPAGIALQGGELAANRATALVYKSAAPVGFRIVGPCQLSLSLSGQSGAVTVECAGYTSVNINIAYSGTIGLLTLAHLAQGVPAFILMQNGVGSLQTIQIAATSPGGTTFTTINSYPSGTANGTTVISNMISPGLQISSGSVIFFSGGAIAPLAALFSR